MSVRVDRYNNNYVQPRKRTMSTNSTSSSGRTRSGTISSVAQDISDVMSLVITQDRDTKNGSGVTGQHDKDVQYVRRKCQQRRERNGFNL